MTPAGWKFSLRGSQIPIEHDSFTLRDDSTTMRAARWACWLTATVTPWPAGNACGILCASTRETLYCKRASHKYGFAPCPCTSAGGSEGNWGLLLHADDEIGMEGDHARAWHEMRPEGRSTWHAAGPEHPRIRNGIAQESR